MTKEEFKVLQKELVHYTDEPSTYDEKFHQYINRIRSSSMTSQQIAELRDSIGTYRIGSTGDSLRNKVRGQLEVIFNEKRENEIYDSKPWMTRFREDHPITNIIIWLGSVILAGVIGFYVNEVLR